jgi:putative membrane protein
MKPVLLSLLVLPAQLPAHTGAPLEPHDLWIAWIIDPAITIPLFITALLYARGWKRTRPAASRARQQTVYRPKHHSANSTLFWTGWLLLALALISPLHALGESLFSAHMAQHEILMLGAAPLLVLSRPLVPMLWGLPLKWRRAAGTFARARVIRQLWTRSTNPLTAWWIHAVILWVWHAPKMFQATLQNDWVHAAQHVSFLVSALLFWWSLLNARARTAYGLGVLYIFTTAIHTSILGALLTLTSRLWYPAYSLTTSAWGLTPLEDQQLGGLIMWVPAGLVYVAAGLGLFGAWLKQSDELVLRRYAQ